MANRLAFHYIPKDSALHRWDARCKLIALLIATVGLTKAGGAALAGFTVIFAATAGAARAPVRNIVADIKGWWALLGIIFMMTAWSAPGPRMAGAPWLPVSAAGAAVGGLTCWRLTLMLGLGALFTATTPRGELQKAVAWLLRPFPFVPARRVAFMATLTIHFLPLLLDQSEEVRMASRARLGERRKNPIERMKFLALPLLRRSFLRAEELTLAMAARGYREDLPMTLPGVAARHWAGLAVAVAAIAGAFYGAPMIAARF